MEAYRTSVRHETITASIDTPEERHRIKHQIQQLNRYILTLQANCIRTGTPPTLFAQALEFFQPIHYVDIVQERLIQGICGFPLCSSGLPSPRLVPATKELMIRNKVAKDEQREVRDTEKIESYCCRLCMVTSLNISKQISDVLPYSRLFDGRNYRIDVPSVWPPPVVPKTINEVPVSSPLPTSLPTTVTTAVASNASNISLSSSPLSSSLSSSSASSQTFSSLPSSSSSSPSPSSSTVSTITNQTNTSLTSSQSLLNQQLRSVGINPSNDTIIDALEIKERTANTTSTDPSNPSNFTSNAIEGFIPSSTDIPSPLTTSSSPKPRSRFARRTKASETDGTKTTVPSPSPLSSPSVSNLAAYVVQDDPLVDLQSLRKARTSKYKRSSDSTDRSRTNFTVSTTSTNLTTDTNNPRTKGSTSIGTALTQASLSLSTQRNASTRISTYLRDSNDMLLVEEENDDNPLIDNDFSSLFLAPVPERYEWNKPTHPQPNHAYTGTNSNVSNASSELYTKQGEDKVSTVPSTVVSSSSTTETSGIVSSSTVETKSILKTASSSSSLSPSTKTIVTATTDPSSVESSSSSFAETTVSSTKKQVHFVDDNEKFRFASPVPEPSPTENHRHDADDGDTDESDDDKWWKRYVGDEDDGDDDDGFLDDEEMEGAFGGIWDHSSIRLPYEDEAGRSTGYASTMKALREERGETKTMDDERNDDNISNATKVSSLVPLTPLSNAGISHSSSRSRPLSIPPVNKSDIIGFGSIEAIGLGYSKEDKDDVEEDGSDNDDNRNVQASSKSSSLPSSSTGIGKDGLEHPISISVSNQRAFGVSSYGILWSALSAWRTNATVAFLNGTSKLAKRSTKDLLDLRNYIAGEVRTSLPIESDTSLELQERTFNAALAVAIARRDLLLSYIGRAVQWIITTATSVPSPTVTPSSSSSSTSTVIIDPMFVHYIQSANCEERLPVFLSTWSMRNPIPLLADHEWRILAMVILVILYATDHYAIPLVSVAPLPDDSLSDPPDTLPLPVTVPAPENVIDSTTLTAAQTLFTNTVQNKTVIFCTDTLVKGFRTAVAKADEAKKLKKKNTKITSKETQPPPGSILTVQQIANLGHLLAFGPDIPTPSENEPKVSWNTSPSSTTTPLSVPAPKEIVRGNGTKPGEQGSSPLTPQERLIRAELEMLEAYRHLGKH